MMTSVPAFAPVGPPETGASSIAAPRAFSACAIRRAVPGAIVLMSMCRCPARMPSAKPCRPRTTDSTSASRVTIVIVT
jgi:hypothetical protein